MTDYKWQIDFKYGDRVKIKDEVDEAFYGPDVYGTVIEYFKNPGLGFINPAMSIPSYVSYKVKLDKTGHTKVFKKEELEKVKS